MTAAKKFLLAALATVALLPATAKGAQYTVHACGDGNNNSFFGAANDSRMAARSLCAADADGHRLGVAALAGVGQGQVPVFANATQSFLAPPNTTITHVHFKADARTANGDWAAILQASTDRFDSSLWNVGGCLPRPGDSAACQAATPSVAKDYDLPGATGFRSVVACGNFAGCGTFTTGVWPFSRAYYLMHQVDVTLDDPTPPTVAVNGGELAEGGWVRGSARIVYDTGDNSGVSGTQLVIDDTVFDHFERPCDYTFTAPCGTFSGLTYTLDTSRIADGPHRVTVAAYDATDVNRGTAVRTALVDNHAPAEPLHPSVDGGEGWHTTDDFIVHWSNPASAAPITRALYEICRPGGGVACVSGEQTGNDISHLSGLHVGQPGDYTIRIWLADAAGNVSDAKSSPLHLKFDNVPPAQAQPQHRNGWVNKNDAKRLDQQIDPTGTAPASGIAGYAVTSDGTEPNAVVNVSASAADAYVAHTVLADLPEGTTTLKARAISGAGVASREVGSTDLNVDLTPPDLMTGGEPSGEAWSNKPVFLTLGATDPGTLSGMAGRPSDQPITSGAYLTYSIDGVAHEVRGTERAARPDGLLEHVPSLATTFAVGVDGTHRITFRAADVAGNGTSERAFSVKIDQAPPELAVFEPQQRADPSLISVAAADRTSGLADGARVRFHRLGSPAAAWITLTTARTGDHYYARIENTTLPEGDYEFQAIIPDQAGNEALANTDRDGREEVLHISPTQIGPYSTAREDESPPRSSGPDAQDASATVDTRLAAWAVQRTVKRKCKRLRPPRRGRKCSRPHVTTALVHDLRVAHGKVALIRGVLTTSGGTAIGGAELVVLQRHSMAGGRYFAAAAVVTDKSGAFAYRAPRGSSRMLDFHYRGDSRYKHADDQVTLRVPAAATIHVNKHAVRNGAAVVFSGKLDGPPYPAKGKVLDLQAYYRGKWRTFATPRANRRGGWKTRYRFQATRGTVRYRFRIRVRTTSDYPYELGYSRTTTVRVRGR